MFAHTNLITYESLYSSSYLLNEYLLYDKLWGPSQRVVTLLYTYSSWGDHEYGWIYYILVLVAGNLRILFTASLTWIWARACDRKNCLFAFAKTCLHFYGMNDHNDIEQLDIPYLSFHSSGIIARLVESSSPIERRPVNPSVVWLCERVLGSSTGKYHQRCSTALYTVYTVYTVATRFQKFHFLSNMGCCTLLEQ